MSNYNKVKTEGVEEFDEKFPIALEGKYIDREKVKVFLSTYAEKVHKATLEDNAQELRNILNRCKTERGLGVAIANYIKTLTK